MKVVEKALLGALAIIYGSIFLYSFTQTDLNLTLINNQNAVNFIGFFQKIGYFNREFSTFIYLTLISSAFLIFIVTLRLYRSEYLSTSFLKLAVTISFLSMLFSYPFLSYDIFNYIFDAKIIVDYRQNPYFYKPLDFPNDELLRFMRWTHRYTPYGPVWLAFSTIPYILGFGKFLLILFNFKLFIGIFHICNLLLIRSILKANQTKYLNFYLASYALNPLILLEGIANSHNDLFLLFFMLLTLYFTVKRYILGQFTAIIFGLFTKYVTFVFVPATIISIFKKLNFISYLTISTIFVSVFITFYSSLTVNLPYLPLGSIQNQFQPWYLLWLLPLISLLKNKNLVYISTAISFGAMLRYLPYLYFGDWSHIYTRELMTAALIIPTLLLIPFLYFKKIRQLIGF